MKNIFLVLLITILLFSCGNESEKGKVIYKMQFTTDKIILKNQSLNPDSLYSQFGDYITSLTPTQFIAQIWTIGYIDTVMAPGTNSAQVLQYIIQSVNHLPLNDPARMVDFSSNVTLSFNPEIYGRVNNDGQFEDKQIDFKYFYFMPRFFCQIVQLPAEYENIKLDMFPPDSLENNILKISQVEMLKKIFPNANTEWGFNFFFGNTDSSFVVNPNGEMIPTSDDNPISSPLNSLIIRSNKYTNMIYNAPLAGETVVMNGVLSFDTINLIQVYTGADNIPYTSDDVFVYAPNFWERIYSKLEII
ncbi:MAG: hypothetical protein IPM71_06870 [Bacteroidota bacterium]|nr:MAG: hypothetical protein IPM71_06870 [Bacteroidota bacterium]